MSTFENIQEEIASMLSLSDDELTEEQKALMDQYLDELGSQEEAKVDGFCFMVRKEMALAEFYKAEADRLAKKAKTIEKRLDWLKGKYLSVMLANGLKKINGRNYSLSTRKSERVVTEPVVTAEFFNAFPQFVNYKESFDYNKTAIREALKKGEEIPGCALVDSYSLQIR